jgi:uncharacterized protein (UPF0332 family)
MMGKKTKGEKKEKRAVEAEGRPKPLTKGESYLWVIVSSYYAMFYAALFR